MTSNLFAAPQSVSTVSAVPRRWRCRLALGLGAASSPLALAQASPFSVGAAAVQNNFLVIFTPIAVVAVMGIAIAFWFNRISAGWAIGCVVGIALFFGAPQIVAWVRAMFGV